MLNMTKVLFLGIGKSSVFWYRAALPAIHLGADWCGVRGEPPNVVVMTGLVRGETTLPDYRDYEVVVLQQVYGRKWLLKIRQLQSQGIKVLYEIDDYLHGVDKQTQHDFAKYFTKDRLREYEMCMRVCDGIITSTDYIARRYAKFNKRVYICRNGLDLARYQLTRPERPAIVPPGVTEIPLYGGTSRGPDGQFVEAVVRVGSTFVDNADAERARTHRWLAHPSGYAYAVVGDKRRNIYLHRFLMDEPENMSVDHRNQDKLDNRRDNLEAITEKENKRRRMFREGSPTRGTSYNQRTRKWIAYVDTPDGRVYLGHQHATRELAAAAVAQYRADHQPIRRDGPERIGRMVMVGWAGATGHIQALVPWLNATIPVLRSHPDTAWVSIGGERGVAEMVGKAIGRERHAIGIPFTTLECYPAAMCMVDIMLAPAGRTGWYRGKSDLRWLEASALGIPTIADPVVYPEIEDGVTGFHAETPERMTEILRELVADEDLRVRVGKQARDHVEMHRSSEDAAMQWSEVLSAVAGEYESMHQLRRS